VAACPAFSPRPRRVEEASTFATTPTAEGLAPLVPDPTALRLVACEVDHPAAPITLALTSTPASPLCPRCTTPAPRLPSDDDRPLADVPWAADRVRVRRRVRTWYGRTPYGRRRSFTERLPTVAAPWARRPRRLTRRLVAVGLAWGGKAGVRLSPRCGLTVSRNALRRVMRRPPLPAYPRPTVLGVDAWSLRTRHTSGPLRVGLERRRPLALRSARDADTLARWLRAHPGVQRITRARAQAEEAGARAGAPAALQVADRFRLVQPLAAVLAPVFNAHLQELNALNDARHQPPGPPPHGVLAAPVPPPLNPSAAVGQAQQRRARRLALSAPGWAWPRQGSTGDAMARQWRLGNRPVFRDRRTATVPARQERSERGRRGLDPAKPALLSRGKAGCRAALALVEELKGPGDPGRYPPLARDAPRVRQAQGLSARQRCRRQPVPAVRAPEPPRRTPRWATWLLRRRPARREARQARGLTALAAPPPAFAEAMTWAQDFAQRARQRQPDDLELWLARAASRLSEAFRRFANRLRAADDSVKAGVTLPWSHEHVAYCTSSPASWPVGGTDSPATTAWRDRLWGNEHTGAAIIIARSGNPAAVIPAPHGLFAHAQVCCDLRRRAHPRVP
jgi:transposase